MHVVRIGTLMALCLCIHLAALASAAPPEIDWTDSYNGPASYWDSVSDAAVHGGSLHVVGFVTVNFQDRAFITIKYAADGTAAWSRIYEGPGDPGANTGSEAAAVAVDEAGNVYVTGRSAENLGEVDPVDAATLKYSPEGELLWERRYRGSGGNVQPSAIALDPGGFVYVAGGSWIDGGFDVFLLKYDLDGNLLWSRTRGQPGPGWDTAFAMALDASGNPVLGGYTQPGDLDVYVLKYASDGSFLWEWTLFGVANVEEVIDLAVDSDGNTYALAQYAPPWTYTSLLTVKLSPSGALLWSDVYSGQSTGDYAAGIEIASDGSVFAAGAAWENGSQNGMTLIKYAPDGRRLWVRSERGGYYSAECNDLAVDAAGAAYMTGYAFDENGREDYLTAKYDRSGNLVWTAAWDAPEGRSDIGYLVRVGSDSRIHVIGDAWRDFTNYYDITSVVYLQNELVDVEQPDREFGAGLVFGPNPVRAGDFVTVRTAAPVEIFGIDGRLVLRLAGSGATSDAAEVQFRAPSSGMYLVRSGERMRKLVVLSR